MQSLSAGAYDFRIGLYADPDLSPANLGEAFDYYSAVPGWGWRAVVLPSGAQWNVDAVVFGASLGDADFAPPDPEGELDSAFPCGRAVALAGGGLAYEGGVALPLRGLPGLGDEVAVWVTVRDGAGEHGVQLSFTLREDESWDALVPAEVVLAARKPGRARRTWSPADEPTHAFRATSPAYAEPTRAGLPTDLTPAATRAVAAAREAAGHDRTRHGGSDDLLLGILFTGDSAAARALASVGAGYREARAAVQFLRTATLGLSPAAGEGLDPGAEKALRLAGDEARREGEGRIATRHLLLGLLRQKGEATAALEWLGVSAVAVREALAVAPGGTEE